MYGIRPHKPLTPQEIELAKMDLDTLGPCGCTDYHMSDCPLLMKDYYREEGSYSEDF